MIRKLLKFLLVVQSVSNEKRYDTGLKRLGRGYNNAYRLNPYNPLSYIVVVIGFVVGILLFGFVGIWREISGTNPFKWD